MSEIPGDLKFLKSHEWARVEDNGTVTIGISDGWTLGRAMNAGGVGVAEVVRRVDVGVELLGALHLLGERPAELLEVAGAQCHGPTPRDAVGGVGEADEPLALRVL